MSNRISWETFEKSREDGPRMTTGTHRWDAIRDIGNTTEARFPDRSGRIPDANARRLASIDLNRAVRDGRVVKPEHCQECGVKTGRGKHDGLHGHHTDYTKPLHVIWLCRPCHMQKHRLGFA